MNVYRLENWKFCLDTGGGPGHDPWAPDFDDSMWQDIVVPHDWAVGFPFSERHSSGTGYLPGGAGWYRAIFPTPRTERDGRVFASFDGVYKHSQVWCNGYYLGGRASGFCGFSLDITHCLRAEGGNLIAVKADHRDIADSRWYTGSGIYRKVQILTHGPVYVPGESVRIESRLGDNGKAAFIISGEVYNSGGVEPDGLAVEAAISEKDGGSVEARCALTGAAAGERRPFTVEAAVPSPRLWSPETPYLYAVTLRLTAKAGDGRWTLYTAPPVMSGLRTIALDSGRGFFLNGGELKIKGVCVHDDAGTLGVAVWPEVWRRRLEKLKAAGCNAIRMSHNPHMDELYDLCDEMGFLVMDEAFDEWEGCKNKWTRGHNVYPPVHQGAYEDFPACHEQDLADMVIRGRNHPSVIMWSIGNEIDYPNDPYVHPLFTEMTGNNDANKPKAEMLYNPGKPNMERLAVIAAELTAIVKKHDTSRPVIVAAAFPELSSCIGFFDAVDAAGYNYKEHLYDEDHRRFPHLPIIGSENGPGFASWKTVEDRAYISGQFLWTGIDYMGEAHGWPVRGSAAGLLDLAGYEKTAWYRRKRIWSAEPTAYLATRPVNPREGQPPGDRCEGLFRSWNYSSGCVIQVICYTTLDEAELFCNETSFGVRRRDEACEYISWEIPFARGVLRVEARGGAASDSLSSTLPGVQIRMRRWTPLVPPAHDGPRDGSAYRLHQIEAEILDEAGRLCPGESPMIEVSLEGPGRLLGIENGDLSDCTAYRLPRRRAYHGRLLIYALTEKNRADKTVLTAAAEAFVPVSIGLE